MTEDDIKSYMEQFYVDRETAIKQINEALKNYYKNQEKAMQEVYKDIIKSSH